MDALVDRHVTIDERWSVRPVSTAVNAGVPPTQIAEWAGHSVAVLLHVYAKCIVGQDEAARLRIAAALCLGSPGGTVP